MRLLKRLLLSIAIIVIAILAFNFNAVKYGLQQASGQAEILWNAVEISQLENDPLIPDSIKEKFKLIHKIKVFAQDSLGLATTDNYTTYYDQKNKPILWTVIASPEFEIKAYEWDFPLAGSFPYKGFFDLEKAKKEELRLKNLGFDTEINEVSAWSTLGWFKDPILSSMLTRSAGRLADLIIHETTHATLYLKDSAQYNENLANFVGRQGADGFLASTYGINSPERTDYQQQLKRREIFRNYMQSALVILASNYNNMDSSLSQTEKRKLKTQWIQELKMGLAKTTYYQNDSLAIKKMKEWKPNNAYFSGFNTYSDDIPLFEKQLKNEFNGDLKSMILSFKRNGLSL